MTPFDRVSRRFSGIATDSQLWRQHYYNRFVRPRAVRLPSRRDAPWNAQLTYSSKLSKWLDEDNLVKRGKETNWKRQYKLRDNWSRGSCAITEIPVTEHAPRPPLLARLQYGILVTVDMAGGLRAWAAKGQRRLLATAPLGSISDAPPTSLAVDSRAEDSAVILRIAVGFEDGRFTIFHLDREKERFEQEYSHEASSNGDLGALSFASPYLLTMTSGQLLSLYVFPGSSGDSPQRSGPPRLLSSLKSYTAFPPLSLSVRPSGSKILACVTYALPSFFGSWGAGLQEIHLSLAGEIVQTRLASSLVHNAPTLSLSLPPSTTLTRSGTPSEADRESFEHGTSPRKPTSLSYNHPYLLLGHADNTLTLHLVNSTASRLSISPGSRLWGHTSSVSSAQVSSRGKAVSVSLHGDELRIWELEGGLSSPATRRRLGTGELSVQVRSPRKARADTQDLNVLSDAILQRGSGLGLALESRGEEVSVTRGWVGFDEENVVVLREKSSGSQALVVYDFS